jgi:hypothetical protein
MRVFSALRTFFRICARSHIQLSHSLEDILSGAAADRCEVVFRQSAGAWYARFRRNDDLPWITPAGSRLTAGYAVFEPEVWPKGPRLLALFGMGGIETLIWSYIIARRHSVLFHKIISGARRRFVMGEFAVPGTMTAPLSLSFLDSCEASLLANVKLP